MAKWHKFESTEGVVWVNFDNIACVKVSRDGVRSTVGTEICYGDTSVKVSEDILTVMKIAKGEVS